MLTEVTSIDQADVLILLADDDDHSCFLGGGDRPKAIPCRRSDDREDKDKVR
ncbi:MAG: hypothetical protein ABSD12_19995 [Paraburkholderia sp.]|jgi:hypothetical protein